MIVVLDASTFVSAALKSDGVPERALLRALNQTNRLLLSQEVEGEYREVIFRPKIDRYVSVARRQRILDIAVVAAERIEPEVTVRECRDPKDDKYLTLAAAGYADVIVSSDVRHLLSMHPWRGIQMEVDTLRSPAFAVAGTRIGTSAIFNSALGVTSASNACTYVLAALSLLARGNIGADLWRSSWFAS